MARMARMARMAPGRLLEHHVNASDEEIRSASQDEASGGDEPVEQHIGTVSFAALKQAQDALARKRKRAAEQSPEQNETLERLHARLRQMGEEKSAGVSDDNDADSDSDSAPSEEGAPSTRSKHAPMSQSSKYQVSRKRQVVALSKSVARDPRFDAFHSHSSHPNNNSDKAYAFLRHYQQDEIVQLKAAVKATKNADDMMTLKRKLMAMENRLKAKEAQERQQEVLRRHRKEEKGKIEQGKKPFYLKKGELRERALVEKFKGMKGKEREKVLEKRRLKESQREKRRMPRERRAVG